MMSYVGWFLTEGATLSRFETARLLLLESERLVSVNTGVEL